MRTQAPRGGPNAKRFYNAVDLRNKPASNRGINAYFTGTDATRSALLASDTTAGCLVAKDSNTIQFFGLPRGTITAPPTALLNYVGTGSLGFTSKPIGTAANLNQCVYVLRKKRSIPAGLLCPMGPSFTSSKVRDLFPTMAKREQFQIIRLPIGLPVTLGHEEVHTGTMEEEHVDMLSIFFPSGDGNFWYEAVSSFDPAVHNIITDPANAQTLAQYMPPSVDTSVVAHGASPYVHVTAFVSDDEEQDYEGELNSIRLRLAALQAASAPPSAVASPPPFVHVNSPAGVGVGVGAGVGDLDSTIADVSQAEAETTSRDQVKLQLLLASLQRDEKGSYTLSTGDINPAVASAYTASSVKEGNTIFGNVLAQTVASHVLNRDKLVSLANLGNRDKLFYAYLRASLWLNPTTHAASLSAISYLKQGAHLVMLLPDDAKLAEQRRKSHNMPDAHGNESVLGEHAQNMSRVDTKLHVMTEVPDVESVIAGGANIIAVCRTGRVYDESKPSTPSTPVLHEIVWALLDLVFTQDYRNWTKRVTAEEQDKLAYWLFTQLESITSCITSAVRDEAVINLAIAGNTHGIDVTPYWLRAKLTTAQSVATFWSFLRGDSVPKTEYYLHSPQYKASQQREQDAIVARVMAIQEQQHKQKRPRLEQPPPTNPSPNPRGGGGDKAGGGDGGPSGAADLPHRIPGLSGDLTFTKRGMLPMPEQKSGIPEMCGADLREGKKCRNPNCIKQHGGVKLMSSQQKQQWSGHVTATDGLSWTSRVKQADLA